MSLAWIRQIPGVRTAGIRMKRVWWALSRKELFPPGHYYSPTPDERWIAAHSNRLFRTDVDEIAGIDLQIDKQQQLLAEFAAFAPDFQPPLEPADGRRYFANNPFFGCDSAFNLYAMMRKFRPKRVVEVGSGFSSALMLDTNEAEFDGRVDLTFIEPNPQRLQSLIRKKESERTHVVKRPVQDVPLDTFERLEANDFLFVDSSHVSKIGSDLNHIVFEILPRLKPGVLAHFHDITWPFEYPERWLNEGRYWNEAYLLRAFLQFNTAFEVVLFDDYFVHGRPEFLRKNLPDYPGGLGSSLWIRRIQ